MRTPPNGKQGKPGTRQIQDAIDEAARADRLLREISARQTLSDKPYADIPCTNTLPLCAQERREARITACETCEQAAITSSLCCVDHSAPDSDIVARRDYAGTYEIPEWRY